MTCYIPKQTEVTTTDGILAVTVYHPYADVAGHADTFREAYNAMLDDLYAEHVDDCSTHSEAAALWNELQEARL